MSEEQRAILTITRTTEQGWVLAFQSKHWAIDAMAGGTGANQVRYDLIKLPDEYMLNPSPVGDPWAEIDAIPTRPLPDPPPMVATKVGKAPLFRVAVMIERDGEPPITMNKLVYAWSIDVDEDVEEAVPRTVDEIIAYAGRSSPPRWRRGSTRLTTIVLKDLITGNGDEH